MSSQEGGGTFIVRPVDDETTKFLLSVKYCNDKNKSFFVSHYKIRKSPKGFYITMTKVFPTVQELVMFYSSDDPQNLLDLRLPCPKPTPPVLHQPSSDSLLEIPHSEITREKLLGEGCYGNIHSGTWNKIRVALKSLKPTRASQEQFFRESEILNGLNHLNILRICGVCSKREPFYIVLEFATQGSLLEYLQKKNPESLKVDDQIYMSFQIACGLAYLEMKKVIHSDIAARNMLVGEKNLVKIGDFGAAHQLKENEDSVILKGKKYPVKWTAPEVILVNTYSSKSDVWSFGILLMEIYTFGETPYGLMSKVEVRDAVLERNYRMPKPITHYLPEPIYQIMLECWKTEPKDRPTSHFLMNHLKEIGKKLHAIRKSSFLLY